MATYLNKDFGAQNYAKFRPTYPRSLYDYLDQYITEHRSDPTQLAVDLACGTGQATKDLATLSNKVIGIDHSSVMIEEARKCVVGDKFDFAVGTDLELTKLFKTESVDLLTVAEAAHWLHYPEFWDQAYSVLKPGGTLAIWSYWTFSFPEYPEVADIITDYAYSKDKCGPYWDEGREMLNNQYRYLRDTIPTNKFSQVTYKVNHFDQLRPEEPFEQVKRDVEVGSMISLLKTWSPYFNYVKENPHKPDIADQVMVDITSKTGLIPSSKVTVKWNTVLLFATRN